MHHDHTIFEWFIGGVALFFAVALPIFIFVPPLLGRTKPLKDDWIGFDK